LFSPSHASYLERKFCLKKDRHVFSAEQRAEMVKVALENDKELKDIAELDRIELDAGYFIDHPDVVRKIAKREKKRELIVVID
jgi:nicotinic acid mononucleotide adenylyltransferase